jgi:hypothetical protein
MATAGRAVGAVCTLREADLLLERVAIAIHPIVDLANVG